MPLTTDNLMREERDADCLLKGNKVAPQSKEEKLIILLPLIVNYTKTHYIINSFIVVIACMKNRKTTQFLDNQSVPSISQYIFGITPSRAFRITINRLERPNIEREPFY